MYCPLKVKFWFSWVSEILSSANGQYYSVRFMVLQCYLMMWLGAQEQIVLRIRPALIVDSALTGYRRAVGACCKVVCNSLVIVHGYYRHHKYLGSNGVAARAEQTLANRILAEIELGYGVAYACKLGNAEIVRRKRADPLCREWTCIGQISHASQTLWDIQIFFNPAIGSMHQHLFPLCLYQQDLARKRFEYKCRSSCAGDNIWTSCLCYWFKSFPLFREAGLKWNTFRTRILRMYWCNLCAMTS